MKPFRFPLERVLDWRRLNVQIAEAELERLYHERTGLEQRRKNLAAERIKLEAELLAGSSVSGEDLKALDEFRRYTFKEDERIQQSIQSVMLKISQQQQAIVVKRRDARLLEKLKDKRFGTWSAAASKEIAQLVEESYLARWKKGA